MYLFWKFIVKAIFWRFRHHSLLDCARVTKRTHSATLLGGLLLLKVDSFLKQLIAITVSPPFIPLNFPPYPLSPTSSIFLQTKSGLQETTAKQGKTKYNKTLRKNKQANEKKSLTSKLDKSHWLYSCHNYIGAVFSRLPYIVNTLTSHIGSSRTPPPNLHYWFGWWLHL